MTTRNLSFVAVLTVVAALATPANAQALAARAQAAPAKAAAQKSYSTAEEAAKALAEAVRAADIQAFLEVIGPASKSWIFSGDKVADAAAWKRFLELYDKKNALVKEGDAKAILTVGEDAWPFPAPLVRKGDRWMFDTAAGKEEVLRRRIGRNELDTIQTLLAIVDAQREYAAGDRDRDGFHDYARRFISTAGKKDGLYWAAKPGEPPSPLGPLVGEAAKKGYAAEPAAGQSKPYNGYLFRMLTAQGKDAAGGAYDYLVKDKLIGGFAILASPAKYGNSGVMSFIVNHDGVVYEKDLGAATAAEAAKIMRFNPDQTWKKSQQ